jgi:hypothetical protein
MRFRIPRRTRSAGIDGVVHAETGTTSPPSGRRRRLGLPPAGQHRARPRGAALRKEPGVKLVTAIIKPFKLDDVKNASSFGSRLP